MGYAVPAAMGAKVGRPDATVWAIDGDGCFQMTNQELATCALEGIPVKIAVINNGNLGMVRQWQTLFYEGRYSNTDLGTHKHRIPDFVKLAEALGCVGLRCETADDVDKTIEAAMAINDAPGGHRLHGRQGRHGVADGRRRHQQRRDHVRPGRAPGLRRGRPVMTMNKHTLSVLVENKPGVLARVSGLFSRRSFNIDSLAVGRDGEPGRLPHHDRGQRRLLTPGAGDQAAQQAGRTS